tara:strand:+ start:9589 stop:10065 length:477 start_codon:yes stop_codon:yes gene_type:complete
MFKSLFFTTIALMIAIAAGLQFFISFELADQCEDGEVHTAPMVAGTCLAGSFVLNGAWLLSRAKKMKNAVRASIFMWTAAITIGVAAAGAVLGQAALYGAVCTAEISVDVVSVQYASIVLLVLAVAAPHAWKNVGKKQSTDSDEGSPLRKDEETPLIL